MSDSLSKRSSRPPTHPGAVLREDVLPALRLSVSEAAFVRFHARRALAGKLRTIRRAA